VEASPSCTPKGTKLEIVAEATSSGAHAFDRDCLAAPAGAAFTIRFDNRDQDTHNVDILDHPGGTSLFQGKVIAGLTTITYKVDALFAGTYYFRCDIHPLLMHGDLIVSG
jgi:plastocyanin